MSPEKAGEMPVDVAVTAPEVAAPPRSNSEIHIGGTEMTNPQTDFTSSKRGGIDWRYMTFTTAIPTTPVLEPNAHIELPPCPDLKQYDSPFYWSPLRKNLITYLSCSVNTVAAYAAGSYAAPEEQLREKWGVSHVAFSLGITLYTIGFGVAPMVLAPLSEINGRRPVFIATGLLFVAMQLACALAPNFAGMLVFRFLKGVGGSTFSTMVGGILADIWVTKERNTPMVLFTGATMFGTGLGPLVSGVVAQRLPWRWVYYVQLIVSGALVALVTVFFKETRGSIILSHKAKAVNKWYEQLESLGVIGMQPISSGTPTDQEKGIMTGSDLKFQTTTTIGSPERIRFKVLEDEQRASLSRMIAMSLYRPIHMLVTEPVVFFFSLWISFAWAILYLQFGSVPLAYRVVFNFTLEQSGYVFGAMCIGAIFSTVLCIWQDKFLNRRYPAKMATPEGRMLATCVEAAFLPISLFWFGWTCYSSIHWIVPTISIAFTTLAIFSIFLAVFNYSADAYHTYTSSALAASGICRNFLGGSFPLLTHKMFNSLGFQAASSLLGGIALVLTLVPCVLVWQGPKIRARSRIAREFMEKGETE